MKTKPDAIPSIVSVIICVFLTIFPTLSARTFTAKNGKTLEAKLLLVQGNYVKLLKEDAQAIWVNSLLLTEHDQNFIKKQGGQAKTIKARNLRYVVNAAQHIDRLVESKLRANGLKPNPPATDEQFLRRIYLQVVGRVPTASETTLFLKSESPGKRRILIDKLLQSEGYVSHNFNYWADILRAKSRMAGDGPAYLLWIKESLRQNKPYDLMVKELLGARGYAWENGSVGYYTRDRGMPLDSMALTTRVFLGTRVECAQCHNHPFEDWTRKQFYAMAAYTYGVNTNLRPGNVQDVQKYIEEKTRREDATKVMAYQKVAEDFMQPVLRMQGVHETPRELRLPRDYQYEDAKPNSVIEPSTLFGAELNVGLGGEKRDAFVDWVISPQNKRFKRVIANRIWKKAMGRGVFEPVDDLREDMDISNPPLMRYLEGEMLQLGYDLKQFQRILYNTRTFHRSMTREAIDPEKPYYFQGPVIRRLSAEQLWDSMLTLTVPDADERALDERVARKQEETKVMAKARMDSEPDTIYRLAHRVVQLEDFSNKRNEMIVRSMERARKNGNKGLYENYKKDLEVSKKRLKKDLDSAYAVADPSLKSLKDRKGSLLVDSDPRWKGYGGNLVRASELSSPAPRGHFLRLFGQSDRESVQNGHQDPVLTQVLALLNGPIFNQIFSDRAVLMKGIAEEATLRDKIEVIFLSTLNRPPSEKETVLMLEELSNYGPVKDNGNDKVSSDKPYIKGYRNIISALMNTRQYMFLQ
jgi:hypothetical protein